KGDQSTHLALKQTWLPDRSMFRSNPAVSFPAICPQNRIGFSRRGTMRKYYLSLALIVIFSLFLSSCATNPAPSAESGAVAQEGSGAMTFVGTPRNETLILDNLCGVVSRPDCF